MSTIDSSLDVREDERSREKTEADLKVPDPKPEQAKAILESYLGTFASLVETQPGTQDFDTKQESLDGIWDSLSLEEKSIAYEQAEPFRKRLKS